MKFEDIYFAEGFDLGDTVFIKNDHTPYIVKEISNDGMMKIVDAKTQKIVKDVKPKDLKIKQLSIPSIDGQVGTEPKEKEKIVSPQKMGKPIKVIQPSLF